MSKLDIARGKYAEAKAIVDRYGHEDRMPATERKRVEQLLDEATDLRRQHDAEPQYGTFGDGFAAAAAAKGVQSLGWQPVAPLDPNRPAILGKGASVVDYIKTKAPHLAVSEEFADGYLGAVVQSLMGEPDNLAAYKSELPRAVKDMDTLSDDVLVPTPIAAFLIDALRPASVLFESGARVVPMSSKTLTVPRVTGDPTAAWQAEGATITPSDGSTDGVELVAKRLAALTKVTDELAEDSNPIDVGRVLRQSLARSFGTEIDRVGLRGSGSGAEPQGVRNATGVSITSSVGAADWDDLADLAAAVRGNNVEPNAFIWAPRTQNAVSKQKAAGSGEYLAPPAHIADIPRRATTSVPVDLGTGDDETEIYTGDFTRLLIGMRVRLEIKTLVERYADEGKIGIRARLRADIALEHGQAFAVGTGVSN